MVVVDSSVWIDFFNALESPQTLSLKHTLKPSQIAITGLILCEVLQGARSSRAFAEIQDAMLSFTVLRGDETALAIAAAENYRTLRSKGVTVRKMADALIATLCIQQKHHLLHNDRDFDAFEKHFGLQVIHP
jgi:predicted nucleic acid-binding protein